MCTTGSFLAQSFSILALGPCYCQLRYYYIEYCQPRATIVNLIVNLVVYCQPSPFVQFDERYPKMANLSDTYSIFSDTLPLFRLPGYQVRQVSKADGHCSLVSRCASCTKEWKAIMAKGQLPSWPKSGKSHGHCVPSKLDWNQKFLTGIKFRGLVA